MSKKSRLSPSQSIVILTAYTLQRDQFETLYGYITDEPDTYKFVRFTPDTGPYPKAYHPSIVIHETVA